MLRPVEKRKNRVEKGVTFVCSTSSHFLVQVGLKDGYWHHDVALLGSPGVNQLLATNLLVLDSGKRAERARKSNEKIVAPE